MLRTRSLARLVLVALSLVGWSAAAAAKVPPQTPLYGIKPGTEMREVRAAYGEPDIHVQLDDGWLIFAYQFEGHNLILETAPDDPEYIRAVQIEGFGNPPGKGLLDVDLGDSVDVALKAFGEPVERRPATDEITGKPVPNTTFVKYTGASFETVDGKITSIKTLFDARPAAPAKA
jgi:hypothetical protein